MHHETVGLARTIKILGAWKTIEVMFCLYLSGQSFKLSTRHIMFGGCILVLMSNGCHVNRIHLNQQQSPLLVIYKYKQAKTFKENDVCTAKSNKQKILKSNVIYYLTITCFLFTQFIPPCIWSFAKRARDKDNEIDVRHTVLIVE